MAKEDVIQMEGEVDSLADAKSAPASAIETAEGERLLLDAGLFPSNASKLAKGASVRLIRFAVQQAREGCSNPAHIPGRVYESLRSGVAEVAFRKHLVTECRKREHRLSGERRRVEQRAAAEGANAQRRREREQLRENEERRRREDEQTRQFAEDPANGEVIQEECRLYVAGHAEPGQRRMAEMRIARGKLEAEPVLWARLKARAGIDKSEGWNAAAAQGDINAQSRD